MKAIYFLASAAMVLSPGLSAEEMQGQASFQQLDSDKDGYVTIIEATGQNQLLRQWTEVDKDTDGRLEITEFSAFEAEPGSFVPVENPDAPEIGAAPTR
jgi:Ca2+-binding EF-hand superfamily protein